ncbi:hypothetical protein Pve01_54810 [Planomonospora venezuelensis]|uniref:Uncharacterized protein n=1 Tax=Planomonospora venezuelensis TaxID=1999 RepID=A0A841CWU6_PLAVE|nr:hypothetical protein [Planomonospora venezuelensis]GIN03823.1 hypothetical protein Pve01_54810 [Planomonospora venezuelensis]
MGERDADPVLPVGAGADGVVADGIRGGGRRGAGQAVSALRVRATDRRDAR